MPNQSIGDEGPASAGGAHGAQDDQVLQLHVKEGLPVVPAFMVHVLPDQLDGRLCPEGFLLRHVEVVDEDDALLADGGTVVALATFLHLAVDGVLGLVGAGLGREGEGYVLIGVRETGGEQF